MALGVVGDVHIAEMLYMCVLMFQLCTMCRSCVLYLACMELVQKPSSLSVITCLCIRHTCICVRCTLGSLLIALHHSCLKLHTSSFLLHHTATWQVGNKIFFQSENVIVMTPRVVVYCVHTHERGHISWGFDRV